MWFHKHKLKLLFQKETLHYKLIQINLIPIKIFHKINQVLLHQKDNQEKMINLQSDSNKVKIHLSVVTQINLKVIGQKNNRLPSEIQVECLVT
jgi:hypothetical protein